jgi:hypothetical protein
MRSVYRLLFVNCGRRPARVLRWRRWGISEVAYESKTAPCNRPDKRLLLSVVTNRLARGSNPAAQCRIGNDSPMPHLSDELILAYDVIAAVYQVHEHVKYLRFKMNDPAGSP